MVSQASVNLWRPWKIQQGQQLKFFGFFFDHLSVYTLLHFVQIATLFGVFFNVTSSKYWACWILRSSMSCTPTSWCLRIGNYILNTDEMLTVYKENGGVIPVFRPTMAEFEDFLSYVQAIDSYGRQAGIVKIIPPSEWFVHSTFQNTMLRFVKF